MRKKIFILMVLGMLVFSSYSITGLQEEKINNEIIKSDNLGNGNEYIPTYCIANIKVYPPWGRMEVRLEGQLLNISNWTGTDHKVRFEWTVNNTHGNISGKKFVTIHTRIREWMYYSDFPTFLFIFTNSGSIHTPNNPRWFIKIKIPIREGVYSGNETFDVVTPGTGSGYIQMSSFNWYFDFRVNPPFLSEWNDGDLYL